MEEEIELVDPTEAMRDDFIAYAEEFRAASEPFVLGDTRSMIEAVCDTLNVTPTPEAIALGAEHRMEVTRGVLKPRADDQSCASLPVRFGRQKGLTVRHNVLRAYPNNHAYPRCDENEMDARNSDDAIPLRYGEEL